VFYSRTQSRVLLLKRFLKRFLTPLFLSLTHTHTHIHTEREIERETYTQTHTHTLWDKHSSWLTYQWPFFCYCWYAKRFRSITKHECKQKPFFFLTDIEMPTQQDGFFPVFFVCMCQCVRACMHACVGTSDLIRSDASRCYWRGYPTLAQQQQRPFLRVGDVPTVHSGLEALKTFIIRLHNGHWRDFINQPPKPSLPWRPLIYMPVICWSMELDKVATVTYI